MGANEYLENGEGKDDGKEKGGEPTELILFGINLQIWAGHNPFAMQQI